MLVLTRKLQEKIQIGDDIVITVLRTKGKTVRLGIEAPSTVPVLRGELAVRIREESNPPTDRPAGRPAAGEESLDHSDSRPGADNGWDRPGPHDARVTLQRVPRSRVATVLPGMLGEAQRGAAGPLRAMLDRRGAGSSI